MKLQMGLEYSDKTSCFELKLFSNASRKFFCGLCEHAQGTLKGVPNLDLCVSKKFVTARRTNEIICQEK